MPQLLKLLSNWNSAANGKAENETETKKRSSSAAAVIFFIRQCRGFVLKNEIKD
jgi:hypothetical protein